jgi:hypothetical protein
LKRKGGLANDLSLPRPVFTARPATSADVPIFRPENFANDNPFLKQENESFLLKETGCFTRLPEPLSGRNERLNTDRLALSGPEMASETGTCRRMDSVFRSQVVWHQEELISPT